VGFYRSGAGGIFIGSMIKPRTSRYIPDIRLKRLFVLLAFYVGLRYIPKGFLSTLILALWSSLSDRATMALVIPGWTGGNQPAAHAEHECSEGRGLCQPSFSSLIVFYVAIAFLFAYFSKTQIEFLHVRIFLELFYGVIQHNSAVFHDITVIGNI